MFDLLNREIRFDVNLNNWGCGFNAALYFVVMPEDGGKASLGYAGATYGTGYCDAQDSSLWKSCVEMDVWESNSLANALTTHGCYPDGILKLFQFEKKCFKILIFKDRPATMPDAVSIPTVWAIRISTVAAQVSKLIRLRPLRW